MRFYILLILITLVHSAHPLQAQEEEDAALHVQQLEEQTNKQTESSVILTPIRSDQDANLKLIQQVCAPVNRDIKVYQLQYADVVDAAEAVNEWLKSTLGTDAASINGFICNAPVLLVVDAKTNSLIVSVAEGFAEAEKLEKLIQGLDRIPANVIIKAVVTGPDHIKGKVVSRSFVLSLGENQTQSLTFETREGICTIELTPRVQLGSELKSTKVADSPRQSTKR